MKVPKYKDDDAKREARKRYRILYQKFRTFDFVIDDEKYFGLSGFQMSANRGYYTSDLSRTPMAVKTYAKKKFEPKVMLWIAMSPKGMSTPVFTSGKSMVVTARPYIDNCLEPHLVLTIPTEASSFGQTRLAPITQGFPPISLTTTMFVM